MDNLLQYRIMLSCSNYQYLFRVFIKYYLLPVFQSLDYFISIQNKHHLYSRLPGLLRSLRSTDDKVLCPMF
jgi:hypothetical protein